MPGSCCISLESAEAAKVKVWAGLLNVGKGGACKSVDSLKMAAYHKASVTREPEKIREAALEFHAWMNRNSKLRATWTLFGGGGVYYNAAIMMKTLKGFLDYGDDGVAVDAVKFGSIASQSTATLDMSQPGGGDLDTFEESG